MRTRRTTFKPSACPRLRAWTGWTALALTLVWGPAARLLHVVEATDPATTSKPAATRTVTLLWNARPCALLEDDAGEQTSGKTPTVKPLAQDDADTPAQLRLRVLVDDSAAPRAGHAPLLAVAPHRLAAPWLAQAPPDPQQVFSAVPSEVLPCRAAQPRAPPAYPAA